MSDHLSDGTYMVIPDLLLGSEGFMVQGDVWERS